MKHLCCYCMFRGDLSIIELESEISSYRSKHSANFKDWIANSHGYSSCKVVRPGFTNSGTMLSNTIEIQNVFKRQA